MNARSLSEMTGPYQDRSDEMVDRMRELEVEEDGGVRR